MKRTFIGIIEARVQLSRQALESIRKANEADSSGLPAYEVRRLERLRDSLYQAVIDFQLVKAGEPSSIIHQGVAIK